MNFFSVPEQRYKAEQPRITSVALLTTRHRTRTTLASHTVYAVRPTTPMGDMMTSTSKVNYSSLSNQTWIFSLQIFRRQLCFFRLFTVMHVKSKVEVFELDRYA